MKANYLNISAWILASVYLINNFLSRPTLLPFTSVFLKSCFHNTNLN
jgi:hypothetical protein